jgi:hypothetical protein
MEKLTQWRGILEKAFSQTERFETYITERYNENYKLKPIQVELLKKLAQDYFNIFREDFIRESKDSKQEIKRIEASFSLEYYFLETRSFKGEKVDEYRYPFAQLKNDLQRGVIKSDVEGGDFVVSHLLATLNYFDWLRGNLRGSIENEPEEFVQLWVNPERDIPTIREIFKALEYIDETEVWNIARFKNPRGAIDAILYSKHSLLHQNSNLQIQRVFGNRFNFDVPTKGFEARYKQYDNTKEDTEKELNKRF